MDEKQAIRERVWALLDREQVARFQGAPGRIPNFVGAEAAAERLAKLPEWRAASTIKANPVIETPASPRPPGILWTHLDDEKIAAIPVLARMHGISTRS